MFRGKKYKNSLSSYDSAIEYGLDKAVDILHGFPKSNFDESVDISVNLGVDPRHADQLVRGMVSLPNGTGKKVKVVVITSLPFFKFKDASARRLAEDPEFTIRPYFFPNNFDILLSRFLTAGPSIKVRDLFLRTFKEAWISFSS